ncbi:MAG: AbrB family transcriptional regulator [bacterium]
METQAIGADGTIQIPAEILQQANLADGTCVSFSVRADGYILVHRSDRDPDQLWFWTEEWQAGEREADEDIKAGRTTTFLSDEAFTEALLGRMKLPRD